jgi:hypothetical protein
MHRKHLIYMWFVIVAIVFFSILGRILFPAYHNVFHGIIVMSILVTLLTCSPVSFSETEKTNSHHKRTRKRSSIYRHRKKKRRTR